MSSIQGEFASRQSGDAAVEQLTQGGVSRDRIHMWNLVPDAGPASAARDSGAVTGAVVGTVFGGLPGLIAGAALGHASDAGADPGLPAPAGVIVSVQDPDTDVDVDAILARCGAANIRTF